MGFSQLEGASLSEFMYEGKKLFSILDVISFPNLKNEGNLFQR